MRTTTVTLLLAFAATLAAAAPAGAAKGFEFGVTASDVDSDSAILWARADRTGTAIVQVVKGNRFPACALGSVINDGKATVSTDNDKTVQKRIGGLDPDTSYHYRFCMSGGLRSAVGAFETAPAGNRVKTIRFALSGDQDALPLPGQSRPYWNNFQIWNLIRKERNDFNVGMGDLIYSDTEVPGYGVSNVATTVPEKWAKYRLNLGVAPWMDARGSATYYSQWDDHEFINDFSKFENSFPLMVGTVKINGKALYKRGAKAFRNYNPVTFSAKNGIYRSFRWGKNLEIFFLDERSFRSQSADYTGACDNPPGSGNPDLAPTLPQRFRNAFALLVPQLANPVPPQCTEKINDPQRTMLGKAQLATFERDIKSSTATFKVIFNEVPIQQFYAPPVYDRWEGYEAERQKVLQFLRDNVENAIFLTTDDHGNLVNDARLRTLEDGGPVNSGITEITTGPIATKTQAKEDDDFAGPGTAVLIHDAFFKPQPPNGVGMECGGMDAYSYAEVTVARRSMKVALKDIHGKTVTDTADRTQPGPPCGPYVFQAQNHPPAG